MIILQILKEIQSYFSRTRLRKIMSAASGTNVVPGRFMKRSPGVSSAALIDEELTRAVVV